MSCCLQVADEAVCKAALMFVKHMKDDLGTFITLTDILPYLNSDNDSVRWYVIMIFSSLNHATTVYAKKHLSALLKHHL